MSVGFPGGKQNLEGDHCRGVAPSVPEGDWSRLEQSKPIWSLHFSYQAAFDAGESLPQSLYPDALP